MATLPLDTRIDAAKVAIAYEKPRLSAVDLKADLGTHESWLERYRAKQAAAADRRH
jgi:hypothetical protein